ncbi:hypothetical protein D3C81_1852960 [compost metagenome]
MLYPAQALSKALGVTYKESGNTATLTGKSVVITVDLSAGTAKVGGKSASFTVDVDNGTLYLPLAAFNQATGKTLKWDTLSERIILK